MSHVQAMLDSHPLPPALDREALARCAQACAECAVACTICADACLGEESVAELRACIRTDLDCADACSATARVVARQTAQDRVALRTLVAACAEICGACAEECEHHAEHHEHCRLCAEACRRCQQACERVLLALA